MQHLLQNGFRRSRRDNQIGIWLLVLFLVVLAVSIVTGLVRLA